MSVMPVIGLSGDVVTGLRHMFRVSGQLFHDIAEAAHAACMSLVTSTHSGSPCIFAGWKKLECFGSKVKPQPLEC